MQCSKLKLFPVPETNLLPTQKNHQYIIIIYVVDNFSIILLITNSIDIILSIIIIIEVHEIKNKMMIN